MRIFLMGMPGCGKTTWGKKLSNKISLPFFDLDEEIERHQSCSIDEIFSEHGEDFFRQLETDFLKKMIQEKDCFVLSLGGGTPCFHNNIKLILSSGISVYFALPTKTLLHRIRQGKGNRPLFNSLSEDETEQKIIELFQQREPYYLNANLQVNALDLQIDELVKQIHQLNL